MILNMLTLEEYITVVHVYYFTFDCLHLSFLDVSIVPSEMLSFTTLK